MERVDSLKRKFESQKLENESNKMRKLPSLLNIETRPNVKNETHKHQMFIRNVSGIHLSFGPLILGARDWELSDSRAREVGHFIYFADSWKTYRIFWNFESQSLNNSTSDSKDSISKSGHVLRMRSKFLSGNASGMIFDEWVRDPHWGCSNRFLVNETISSEQTDSETDEVNTMELEAILPKRLNQECFI